MHIFFTVQSLFGEEAGQHLYVKQRFFAVQINSPLPRFLLSLLAVALPLQSQSIL